MMDKTDKHLANYERGNDLLTVERRFTGEHIISDLLQNFIKGGGQSELGLSAPVHESNAIETAAAEDRMDRI